MQIVIVDYSRVVLRIVASLLEPQGHVVRTFTDSEQALAFLTETPSVRVLISSLEVRPISGLELLWSARLLADERRPLRMITMSSARDVRSIAEALDSGADDFIEKPPRAEELKARLRAAERMTTMQEELIRLAETDPLTGLYNRRAFLTRAGAAVDAVGSDAPLSAVLIDIDHFKRINDTHGHDVGDRAIQAVAALLAGDGISGRFGGEEFALILPGCDLGQALEKAERLRRRVEDQRIPGDGDVVRMSCSFGVSAWIEADSVAALIKRADMALYAAKNGGRNRVMTLDSHGLADKVG